MKTKMLQKTLVYDGDIARDGLSEEKRLVLERVGKNKSVLEVGAHTGYFSGFLRKQGCKVTAVEMDPRAVVKAERVADEVIIGDIEDPHILAQIEGRFDVILFMHVLEHMVDPWRVLREMKRFLNANSSVILLLPNIACWRVRKDLFFKGSFEYTEIGILDRTHLRFFTLESARELLEKTGFETTFWAPTDICVPLERRISRIPGFRGLSRAWHDWMSRRYPNLCSEIFLFEAVPKEAMS